MAHIDLTDAGRITHFEIDELLLSRLSEAYLDDRYVNVPGDTMTGPLNIADADYIGNGPAKARLHFDSSGGADYAYFSGCFVGIGIVPTAPLQISHAFRFPNPSIIVNDALGVIAVGTTDGADTGFMVVSGGGASGNTRGGGFFLYGNERAANYFGRVDLAAGNVHTSGLDGSVNLLTGGHIRLTVLYSGLVGNNEINPGAQHHIQTSGPAVIGQIIRGTANQATNLLELQESDGSIFLASGDGLGDSVFSGNQQLEDIDFVWAGDTEANLFRVDAGADEVRMGDWDTNYSAFEVDGTLKFIGNATVFNDLQFAISNAKVPASNAPDWETFTTNTNEYGFAVDDYIDTQANEILHSWKLGSTGHVHLHVTTKAANSTGSNRFAKFTVVVAYCDTGETWQESTLTAELTVPNGTSALEQFYLDMGNLTLTNYVEEAEVRCRVARIAATGGTEYAGNIFITQAGIHLESDTIGSRTETSK